MELSYAQKPKDEEKAAVAMGRDLNISLKDAIIVANRIRGVKLLTAINLLKDVSELKRPIPYDRFKKGIGHRKGSNPKVGRFPVKVAGEVLNVLKNAQSNAEFKGLDIEKLNLTSIQTLKGIARRRRKPKGRWATWRTQLVHIQVVVGES